MAREAKDRWPKGGAAFWAVAAGLNVITIGSTLQAPLYVHYQQRFGFDEIVLTLIYAAYLAGTLAALTFFGRLSDQIGRRPVMLLSGTVVAGVSLGLGFRGSLQVVNQIAPAERRAEILSTYFIVACVGVAVPVIGVGILAQLVSPEVADVVLALVIGVLAVLAIVTGIRYGPKKED